MKLFLALLSIALVAQVSMADEKAEAYKTLKDIVSKLKPVVGAFVKDIPTSDAYRPLREEWQSILLRFDEKKEGDHCINKSFTLIGIIGNNYVNYQKTDATPEKKELLKLFKKHGGDEVLNRYKSIREVSLPVTEFPFEQC